MFNQTFDPGFFISLHNKDLGIARDVSERNECLTVPKLDCASRNDVSVLWCRCTRATAQTLRPISQ